MQTWSQDVTSISFPRWGQTLFTVLVRRVPLPSYYRTKPENKLRRSLCGLNHLPKSNSFTICQVPVSNGRSSSNMLGKDSIGLENASGTCSLHPFLASHSDPFRLQQEWTVLTNLRWTSCKPFPESLSKAMVHTFEYVFVWACLIQWNWD